MSLDMTFVADEGAKPSPSPTKTLETQRSKRLENAAGGATKVPNDQNATPASNTAAPPILHNNILSIQSPNYSSG